MRRLRGKVRWEGDLSKSDAANVLRLDNLAVQSGRVKDLADLKRP